MLSFPLARRCLLLLQRTFVQVRSPGQVRFGELPPLPRLPERGPATDGVYHDRWRGGKRLHTGPGRCSSNRCACNAICGCISSPYGCLLLWLFRLFHVRYGCCTQEFPVRVGVSASGFIFSSTFGTRSHVPLGVEEFLEFCFYFLRVEIIV